MGGSATFAPLLLELWEVGFQHHKAHRALQILHDGAKEKAAADVKRCYGLGMPISFQADGSLDRGLRDKQAMLLSFVGKSGFKETCLLDLRELDMTKSKDGRSPDANATTHCYVTAHVHRTVPVHSPFGGHCHDAHNRHVWLRAPH